MQWLSVVPFVLIGGLKINCTLVLDVTFREDASRIRNGHGPENFSLLRRMAVSLRCSRKSRANVASGKRRARAAMDSNYMLQVLATALPQ